MVKNAFFFFILLANFLFSQNLEFSIKSIKNLQTRKLILLNKNWIYDTKDGSQKLQVPFWIEDERVVIKNKFKLNDEKPSIYYLRINGVRGLEEVYFNDERIPFDPSEIEELFLRIPSYLVKGKGENFVKLIFTKNLRVKEQNILASKLELPERKCGIYKDVYLEILPSYAITEFNLFSELDDNLQTGRVNFDYEISSFKQIQPDSAKNFSVVIEAFDKNSFAPVVSYREDFLFRGSSSNRKGSFVIRNPILWDINSPFIYEVNIKLFQENILIDQISTNISFRKVEINGANLFLNKRPLRINGVTYFESNGVKNSFFELTEYDRDLNLLKELNVNAIFVKNSLPSDELIQKCETNGILVFIDLDSKIYPLKINQKFISEKIRRLEFILSKYSNYGSLVALNLGFIQKDISPHWINSLKEIVRRNRYNILSFLETNQIKVSDNDEVDFIAYNLLHKSVDEIEKFVSKLSDEKFYLVSSFGYNHGIDEEAGYSNPYSVQAQAKYISDVVKILMERKISFFVHSFSDYRLPYHSIIAGKLDNKLMKYGLVNEYRDKKKLSYQTYKSYINEDKLPLIMQGDYTEKANIIYVIAGLIFLAFTIIIINYTNRFRANVSRAVLKTYNFFSDIRDGWFISSFHSVLLAIAIALSMGLSYSGMLYYWKDKVEIERFVSLFNSYWLFEFLSYTAWRPIESIIYLTVILLLWMVIITALVRFFNFFVKNKIFINHAFLIVVWSAIPFLILIPLGMVVFKILSFQEYNLLIYATFVIFHLWVFTRTLKGISIVFETKKSKVYLTTFIFMIIILASLIIYLQINYSSIDYFMEYFG